MDEVAKILLTLAVAAAGGLLFHRLKVPGGAMIGAMAATIALHLTTGLAYIPRDLRVFIQMFAGIRIGSGITKKDVLELRRLVVPAVILVVSMIVLNLLFGTLMTAVGGLDAATAFFACSPGGMTDMAIIADDLGANAVYVVVLQLSRVLFIYTVLPPVFRRRIRKDEERRLAEARTAGVEAEVEDRPAKPALSRRQKIIRFLVTAAAGIGVGFLLWRLGVKAGALLGAMLGVALLNIFTGFTFFPKKLNIPIRFVSGSYIGQQMGMESLIMMTTLGIPVLIMWLGVLVFTFVVPLLIVRFSKLSLATCMLASTPGGMQEMSLLAEDLGADVPKVTLLQTSRQVSVIMIFPTMLSAITTLMM